MELRAPNPLHVTESLLHYGNASLHVLALLQQKYRLTPTQARVATLLADRLTNAEIALELQVRPTTARRHTEAVLLRLGVTSRFQVVAMVADIVSEAQP